MALPPDIQKVKDEIHAGERLAFRVVSGSMEPVVMTGDMIEVEPVELDDLRTFDIVLFWNGSLLICHYLWHVNFAPEADGSRLIITRPLAGYGHGEDLPTPSPHLMGRIVSHRIPGWTRFLLVIKHLFRKKMQQGFLS